MVLTSVREGLVLQREAVKNRRHLSALLFSARPNSRGEEHKCFGCFLQTGGEVDKLYPGMLLRRRTDLDPMLGNRGSAASLLAQGDGTW